MHKDRISSDGFYRNCLCVLEVKMKCVLELEDEIKFENEMKMKWHSVQILIGSAFEV